MTGDLWLMFFGGLAGGLLLGAIIAEALFFWYQDGGTRAARKLARLRRRDERAAKIARDEQALEKYLGQRDRRRP